MIAIPRFYMKKLPNTQCGNSLKELRVRIRCRSVWNFAQGWNV